MPDHRNEKFHVPLITIRGGTRSPDWYQCSMSFVFKAMNDCDGTMTSLDRLHQTWLTTKVFGFEWTYMYEILVTGPLRNSECAGECRLSANLWKRALDVTADVIVEATCNADIWAAAQVT